MELSLHAVQQRYGAAVHLYPVDLKLVPGAVTVLLGATQAGKTSLMRVMAGLDAPSAGKVMVDGRDVTGVPVRQRDVAMVYQQFINYPSLTVAQNIASPLKLRGEKSIPERVQAIAEKLHIEPFLQRLPAELSGGQQQRVALARALAKGAPLMLLDEPLVNLDYKLREGLRDELTALFAAGKSTVVYATTEPAEALLLGGYTAVMDCGELLQYGPTAEVFRHPQSMRVARAFSDPPMNLLAATRTAQGLTLPGGTTLLVALPQDRSKPSQASVTVGLRAGALRLQQRPGDLTLAGRVELAEIAGSDTYVHADTAIGEVVAQLPGVHGFELGSAITLHLDPAQVYVFDDTGALLLAPSTTTPSKRTPSKATVATPAMSARH
ncbi:MAG: ABC transporter ATP-binding protein [Rubrivivax sp.]